MEGSRVGREVWGTSWGILGGLLGRLGGFLGRLGALLGLLGALLGCLGPVWRASWVAKYRKPRVLLFFVAPM